MNKKMMEKMKIINNLRIIKIFVLFTIVIFSSSLFLDFFEILYFLIGCSLMFFNLLISDMFLGKNLENHKLLSLYRNINNIIFFVSIALINYKSSKLTIYLISALLGVVFVRYSYLYVNKAGSIYE